MKNLMPVIPIIPIFHTCIKNSGVDPVKEEIDSRLSTLSSEIPIFVQKIKLY